VHCTDLPEDGVLECEYFFNTLQANQWYCAIIQIFAW
jgi:hypothetical protein